MKIALIGYGKMGHEIARIAIDRGHSIVATIDVDNQDTFDAPEFLSADVAIEFTRPETAFGNYQKCFERHLPVVSGTTGWTNRLDEVKKLCVEQRQTFFYASNFSIGVNIFFELNKILAKMMNREPQYDVRMEEIHHIHKLDSPSGTGITLAEGILENIDRKQQWKEATVSENPADLLIESKRVGEVPGIHEIIYESDADVISIKHDAKNRKGFALGAVLAAEYLQGKTGFHTMQDLLNSKHN
ncbi:MAG: 4-hydroxy-tetrahydrodipicolinate reductase [Candidatus Symbiothrix sp.]|jgi:4-hydroxy-tetrahydrodipicolinate reductase|nr:4-hydroxy-tetrahydrodipicolinate reductase [Candidatus Symbiothrix sp.]